MSYIPRKSVVAPIDFSDSSLEAIREAIALSASPECVHVLHVIPTLDVISPGVLFGDLDDGQRLAKTHEYMDEYLKKNGIDGVRSEVLVGDPGTSICDYAENANAEMIVISSHGYHGVKRLVLGSVAERVIRYANCGVYVTRRIDAE